MFVDKAVLAPRYVRFATKVTVLSNWLENLLSGLL